MLKIRTNNVPRPIIDGFELSPVERLEFDYLDWDAIDDGADSASFFRYRGELYDLGEFMRIEWEEHDLNGWDGYQSDSFFSGLVVKYANDFEDIVIGDYCS